MAYLVKYNFFDDTASEEFVAIGEALDFIQDRINDNCHGNFELYKAIPLNFKVTIA